MATSSARDTGRATGATTPGAALLHPGWLLALGLLLFNDHLLKGSGALPEPMTGKLSDLAGLVVAPVLLTALLGGGARARRLAFVATGLVFALVNLSAPFAAAFDAALCALGIPWQTFVDPTDLLALAVLPLAWRISTSALARRAHPGVRRGLAAVGLLACAASGPPAAWETRAFLVNHAEAPVEVRVRFPQADLDCAAIGERWARALAPDVFGPGVPTTLEPGETLSLSRGEIERDRDVFGPIVNPLCGATLVSVEGAPETLVIWDGAPVVTAELHLGTGDLPEALEASAVTFDGASLRVGAHLAKAALLDEIGPDHCAVGRAEAYGFSALSEAYTGPLTALEAGEDGCARLSFESREAPFFLCVPFAEIPFSPQDVLQIEPLELLEGRGVRLRREGARPVELLVYSDLTTFEAGALRGEVVDRGCSGHRLECGSFVISGALELADGSRIVPGTAAEVWPDFARQPLRLRVGRAERYVVGADACEVGLDRPGARLDLLIVQEK